MTRDAVDLARRALALARMERGLGGEERWTRYMPPAVAVQLALGAAHRPTSPSEMFSADEPVSVGQLEEQIPIDDVLGRYFPEKNLIEIYCTSIEGIANRFNWDPLCLRYLVRLHEHGHAIDHLGVADFKEEFALVAEMRDGIASSLKDQRERTVAYQSMSTVEKEWWAQSVAFVSLRYLPDRDYPIYVFCDFLKHQPPEYRIDTDLLQRLPLGGLREVHFAWRAARDLLLPAYADARMALEALVEQAI